MFRQDKAYEHLTIHAPNEHTANLIQALYNFLGKTDMLAYLVMMAIRLLELYRVLKSTGSIFLYCDMTASHYLKLLMDSIFRVENFKMRLFGSVRILTVLLAASVQFMIPPFFYTKSNQYTWKQQQTPYTVTRVNIHIVVKRPICRGIRN
jgi:site-specific DNA-methyltransferase (adenine-specific)